MDDTQLSAAATAVAAALRARISPPQPEEPDKVLTVDEAAQWLQVSRSLIYKLIGRGELASIRVGRRRFILVADVYRIINGAAPLTAA